MKDWDERSTLDQMWIMSGLVLLGIGLPFGFVMMVIQAQQGDPTTLVMLGGVLLVGLAQTIVAVVERRQ